MDQALKLAKVRPGQPVVDATGSQIGRVLRVRRNRHDVDGEEHITPADDREWMELIARIIEPDDARALRLAKEIWNVGYVKMRGPGLSGLAQYILPGQIDAVEQGTVQLSIALPHDTAAEPQARQEREP